VLFNQDQPQVARVYIFFSRGQRPDCALPAGSTVPFGTDPVWGTTAAIGAVCKCNPGCCIIVRARFA
jgi:hypothetical protein